MKHLPPDDECLDENLLLELSLGQLSQERFGGLERHVDICKPCRRALAAMMRNPVEVDATALPTSSP